jgi:phospholipid transport system substrate-binding protein
MTARTAKGTICMLTRRHVFSSAAAIAAALAARPALADATDQAMAFMEKTSRNLVAVVNGSGDLAAKKSGLAAIIDQTVDVQGVARFCLGRFWNTATAEQRKDYLELFHHVMLTNITSKLGEYQGVTVALGRAMPREGETVVTSVVTRPNNAPSKVDWLIGDVGGVQKIVDVIAEGTSLRLTQRSDYASYLAHNNNNVQALIDAMRQQASQPG